MPETFVAMVLFAVVAAVTPGGATALATASGARFGFRRSVPLLAGIAFGVASLAAASAAGPAALPGTTFGGAAIASLSLWCAGGLLIAQTLRTDRRWRMVKAALVLLLSLSIVSMWLA